MRTTSSTLSAGLITLGLVASLTGCSHLFMARDESAKSQLDYENVIVHKPLDEFKISVEQNEIVERAVRIAIDPCLVRNGQPSQLDAPTLKREDRYYGLWNVERASQYGYHFPDFDPEEFTASDPEPHIYQKCYREVEDTIVSFRGEHDDLTNPSLAFRLDERAYNAAKSHPDWNAARKPWRECIKGNGLTVDGDSWGSKEGREISALEMEHGRTPDLKAEEIRISVIEAQCNKSTNLTQILADIEASYQAPLIAREREALEREKQDIAHRVELARKFIEEHE